MANGPHEEDGRNRSAFMGTSVVPVCRRLQLVTVLLGIVGILGLVTAGLVATSPAGEGLGSILPTNEVDVMGQVRDSEGYLVPDATVTYEKGGMTDTTGTTGWYFLEGVKTGKVELKMEVDGYKTVVKTVHLERGKYTVDFLAEPGTGTVEIPGVAVPEAGDAGERTWLMAVTIALSSGFALLGALGAYLRRWYHLVVVGCLFGTITWGWFIGTGIAIIALLVTVPLRDQFGPKAIECEVPWHDEPPPDLDIPDEGDGDKAIDVVTIPTEGSGNEGVGGMPPG